jgi:hypothetical protein
MMRFHFLIPLHFYWLHAIHRRQQVYIWQRSARGSVAGQSETGLSCMLMGTVLLPGRASTVEAHRYNPRKKSVG